MPYVGRTGRPAPNRKYYLSEGYVPKVQGRPVVDKGHEPWPMDALKLCRGCGLIKPLYLYHRKSSSSTGYQSRCKVCQRAAVARTADLERIRQYARDYSRTHPMERAMYFIHKYATDDEFRENRIEKNRLGRKKRAATVAALG